MHVFLETDRLRLRCFTEADIDRLVQLDSDPQVMRYLTGEPTPRAEIERTVIPAILRDYTRGPAGRWAAIGRSTGEFLGWIALQPPEDGSTPVSRAAAAPRTGAVQHCPDRPDAADGRPRSPRPA